MRIYVLPLCLYECHSSMGIYMGFDFVLEFLLKMFDAFMKYKCCTGYFIRTITTLIYGGPCYFFK